jgi:hypothetical protein
MQGSSGDEVVSGRDLGDVEPRLWERVVWVTSDDESGTNSYAGDVVGLDLLVRRVGKAKVKENKQIKETSALDGAVVEKNVPKLNDGETVRR